MNNGIITTTSNHSFNTTYSKLKEAIENNPKLKIITEISHSKNANSVNLELPESKLIIFGNPNLGTPLMNENIELGIDLPQKMLIYKKDDKVFVAYNDPMYLKKRHHLEQNEELLNIISKALKGLSTQATQ